ncbi:hypothetical protein ACKI1J_20530 [Streptomyces scabiei]|uniref:hypothetical protein n=1 Tax=Streptomyces scabiei TaxID=1930 RepID=UPI0038F7CC62
MPGTVLLLAAAPMGRGCLVDAASVLPVLAAVTPEVLSGTGTANVVELADPLEPQAVLTRLRAAATAPGPLTVFLTGQLQLDRRQRLVHLALARTTPATVRYTAFPWHWIVEELRLRAPGSTTLFVDLHADAEVWRQLAEQPLTAGPGVSLYGRVAPPTGGVRRAVALPGYMKALATILRSGRRPSAAVLHEQVVARAGGHGDLVLARDATAPPATTPHGTATPVAAAPADPAPLPTDPHSAIAGAVEAGRHAEAAGLAACWEQEALREFGDGSEEVLHWREVRADLAMFAGDAAGSCETWLGVAAARLAAGRPARDPAVEAAVDRAHHQWGLVTDTRRALELGSVLVELRGRVPGRRAGALAHARQRLAELGRQEDEMRSAQHVPGQPSRSMSRRPFVVDR